MESLEEVVVQLLWKCSILDSFGLKEELVAGVGLRWRVGSCCRNCFQHLVVEAPQPVPELLGELGGLVWTVWMMVLVLFLLW